MVEARTPRTGFGGAAQPRTPGATPGGSVEDRVIADPTLSWKVRRDGVLAVVEQGRPRSPEARLLADLGAEVAAADMEEPASLRRALEGSSIAAAGECEKIASRSSRHRCAGDARASDALLGAGRRYEIELSS